MVVVKSWEVDRFVARPDPGKPIVLVYGADLGLVRERAETLIAGAVDDRHDPFSLVRIDGDALSEQPERLIEEADTIPLFGGRRAVWVKAGGRNFTAAVERVLGAAPSSGCRIVIEAGELRRASPLRALCERATNAAVLACYADDSKAVDRLIDDELRGAGLSIAADARVLLNGLLGGDRGASRSEIRKLILYAHGANRIDTADIASIVSDATVPAVDDVIDAAFAGRPGELENDFSRARSSGVAAGTIALMASRHVGMLHRLRVAVESGTPVVAAVDGAGPMLHSRRKAAAQSALQLWNAQRLGRLIGQLGDAVLETRKQPRLAYAIVQRALLSIAVTARRKE